MNPLTSALVAMRRSPYQTLAAILITAVTFFVGYTFSLFLIGTERILQYFETRPQIIAFFELNTTGDTITKISEAMKEKSYVADVKVISKEEALKIYQEDNKDDPLLLELVTADILPASIEVSGKQVNDLAQIKQDLETQTGIEEVVYQQDIIESLTGWTEAIRLAGMGSILVLGVTAFLTILVVVSMKVTVKKQVIHIMRIIGATRWYITQPFMYEGMVYGLLGSLIGWSVMVLMTLYLTPWMKAFLGDIPLLPVPYELFGIQLGVGTLVGILFGGFTGIIAVKRMIKR